MTFGLANTRRVFSARRILAEQIVGLAFWMDIRPYLLVSDYLSLTRRRALLPSAFHPVDLVHAVGHLLLGEPVDVLDRPQRRLPRRRLRRPVPGNGLRGREHLADLRFRRWLLRDQVR